VRRRGKIDVRMKSIICPISDVLGVCVSPEVIRNRTIYVAATKNDREMIDPSLTNWVETRVALKRMVGMRTAWKEMRTVGKMEPWVRRKVGGNKGSVSTREKREESESKPT
jgi:hypothetical protein